MFTRKDEHVYAVVLGRPKGDVVLKDIKLTGQAVRVGGQRVPLTVSGNDTVLKGAGDGSYAPVFRVG